VSRLGYLGLGSNLGDRQAHLRGALDLLRDRGVEVEAASSTYETEPVGEIADQPASHRIGDGDHIRAESQLKVERGDELPRAADVENAPRGCQVLAHWLLDEHRRAVRQPFEHAGNLAPGNSDVEHDRVRSSNEQDQRMERQGIESARNRGYDEVVRGGQRTAPGGDEAVREGKEAVRSGEVGHEDLGDVDEEPLDPDSAASDVDREDTVDE